MSFTALVLLSWCVIVIFCNDTPRRIKWEYFCLLSDFFLFQQPQSASKQIIHWGFRQPRYVQSSVLYDYYSGFRSRVWWNDLTEEAEKSLLVRGGGWRWLTHCVCGCWRTVVKAIWLTQVLSGVHLIKLCVVDEKNWNWKKKKKQYALVLPFKKKCT